MCGAVPSLCRQPLPERGTCEARGKQGYHCLCPQGYGEIGERSVVLVAMMMAHVSSNTLSSIWDLDIKCECVEQCPACAGNPCINGGTCEEARGEQGYYCLCPPPPPPRATGETGERSLAL